MTMHRLHLLLPLFLGFSAVLFAQMAPNNTCSGAVTIYQTADYESVLIDEHVGSTNFPSCIYGGPDIYFKFTATTLDAELSAEPINDYQDINIEVRPDSCGGPILYCADQYGAGDVEILQMSGLDIGRTYYVRIAVRGNFNEPKFRLAFRNSPVEPACSPYSLNASNDAQTCGDISTLCDIKGNCGNTNTYVDDQGQHHPYTANVWNELSNAFCGSIENNSFLKFNASDTFALFRIYGDCGANGLGLQFMVYDYQQQNATCDVGGINVYWCGYIDTNMLGSAGGYVNPRNLTPGNEYYMMIDGFAGSLCDYKITPIYGTRPIARIQDKEQYRCTDDTLVLTATGGFGNYDWTAQIPILNDYTDSIVTVMDSAGVYEFYLTDDQLGPNCPATDTGTITVNEPADPYAGLDLTICLYDSILLTPLPSDSNSIRSWSLIDTVGGAIGFPGGQSGDSIYIYASDTGSYQMAFVELTLGCNPVFDTLRIDINSLPDLTTSNDTMICEGDSIQLSVAGADVYLWTHNNATSNTIWVHPNDSTSYAVSGNINNCISLDSIYVAVDKRPILQAWGDTVCAGDTALISVNGALDYVWSNGLANDTTHYLLLDSTQQFNVIGYTTACTDSATVTVVVNTLPTLTFLPFDPDTICISSGLVSLPDATPGGGTYVGAGVVGLNFNPDSSGVGTHTITYYYTDGNGCSADSSQVLTVEECLSTQELMPDQFRIYPNPVDNELQIESLMDVTTVSIFNVKGQVIDRFNMTSGVKTVNMEKLESGVYFIQANNQIYRIVKR